MKWTDFKKLHNLTPEQIEAYCSGWYWMRPNIPAAKYHYFPTYEGGGDVNSLCGSYRWTDRTEWRGGEGKCCITCLMKHIERDLKEKAEEKKAVE